MIFVTVGHELRFDRLIQALDRWSSENSKQEIFAQVAELGDTGYAPKNFEWKNFLTPEEFRDKFQQADFVVAHAGMGTIITAMTLKKPLVIVPRKGSLKETRNDHQIATADQFSRRDGIYTAQDDSDLGSILDELICMPPNLNGDAPSQFAQPNLISAIRGFIFNDDRQLES
jgi:exopolysaccharide biosynthesis glucuronosyltransferase PssE